MIDQTIQARVRFLLVEHVSAAFLREKPLPSACLDERSLLGPIADGQHGSCVPSYCLQSNYGVLLGTLIRHL